MITNNIEFTVPLTVCGFVVHVQHMYLHIYYHSEDFFLFWNKDNKNTYESIKKINTVYFTEDEQL